MQNEIPTLTQGLANPIYQTSNIGVSLNKRLPKVILILSAIILGSIASLKAAFKLEQILIEHKYGYGFLSKDTIRLSPKEFNQLEQFAIKNIKAGWCTGICEGCLGSFINVYATCTIEVYPKVSALFDAKDDVNHPFHGKGYSDIVFMHPDSDTLFELVRNLDTGVCKKGNSIVLTEKMFNNILLDKAKLYFPNNYEISVFNEEDFNKLKLKEHFQENTKRIGPKDGCVYVANKQGMLKKYSQYIKRSIIPENQ